MISFMGTVGILGDELRRNMSVEQPRKVGFFGTSAHSNSDATALQGQVLAEAA